MTGWDDNQRHILTTGCRWMDYLPKKYGDDSAASRRLKKLGIWKRLDAVVSYDPLPVN